MKLTNSAEGQDNMLRKILIRVVIYTVAILGMTWYLNRMAPKRTRPQGTPLPTAPASGLAAKSAELTSAKRKPLVVILSLEDDTSHDYEACRQSLADEYGDGYSVIHATIGSAVEARQYFQVEKLPALLVFDADNQEIKRQEDYPIPPLQTERNM